MTLQERFDKIHIRSEALGRNSADLLPVFHHKMFGDPNLSAEQFQEKIADFLEKVLDALEKRKK